MSDLAPAEAALQRPARRFPAGRGRGGAFRFGPYIAEIPPLPATDRKGCTRIGTADGPAVGWIYDAATGKVLANTRGERDARGRLDSAY